ncbi:hypothetical protein G4O51_08505 [Candidatus Bathyarchaeota archaeon A05DMB-2]|nr:hypothetical protein [Candidatus Bathyarchaeota archaeon A05DMB-2]
MRFKISNVALLLGGASLILGLLILRSDLPWAWKIGLFAASFALYTAVMLSDAYFQHKAEEDKLEKVFGK